MELSREIVESPTPGRLKILLVGPPKEGKTQSAFTFYQWLRETKAVSKQIWLFDFDEGQESLRRKMLESGNIKDLRVFQYKPKASKIVEGATPSRNLDTFRELMKEFNPLYDMVDQRTGKWKDPSVSPGLVMGDSISAIRKIIEDYVLLLRGKEFGGGTGSGVTYDEQGMFKSKLKEVFDATFDLPCHSIWTAHTEIRQVMSKSGVQKVDALPVGESHVVPIVPGDLRWMLPSLFDAVLFTRPDWKWQTRNDSKVKGAGVRTKEKLDLYIPQDFRLILPALVNNPSADKIAPIPKPAGEAALA